jgi:hypothetical protein
LERAVPRRTAGRPRPGPRPPLPARARSRQHSTVAGRSCRRRSITQRAPAHRAEPGPIRGAARKRGAPRTWRKRVRGEPSTAEVILAVCDYGAWTQAGLRSSGSQRLRGVSGSIDLSGHRIDLEKSQPVEVRRCRFERKRIDDETSFQRQGSIDRHRSDDGVSQDAVAGLELAEKVFEALPARDEPGHAGGGDGVRDRDETALGVLDRLADNRPGCRLLAGSGGGGPSRLPASTAAGSFG